VNTETAFETYDGFLLKYDPPKIGNCQFDALADQLRYVKGPNFQLSSKDIRDSVVTYMEKHPEIFEGFCGKNNTTWNEYILQMKSPDEYGDHLTLTACLKLYGVSIMILNASSKERSLLLRSDEISSKETVNLEQTLILGYYPEGQGSHYVSLKADSEDVFRHMVGFIMEQRRDCTERSHLSEPPQTNESDNPAQAGTVPDSCESETVPLGVKTRSWSDWKRSRPWLVCVEGRAFCSLCRGMHNHQFTAVHSVETKDATAFSVNGVVASTAKKLLKKSTNIPRVVVTKPVLKISKSFVKGQLRN